MRRHIGKSSGEDLSSTITNNCIKTHHFCSINVSVLPFSPEFPFLMPNAPSRSNAAVSRNFPTGRARCCRQLQWYDDVCAHGLLSLHIPSIAAAFDGRSSTRRMGKLFRHLEVEFGPSAEPRMFEVSKDNENAPYKQEALR